MPTPMNLINLLGCADSLPQAWQSSIMGRVGGANIKVLRMDDMAYPAETHDYAEALLVLEGQMRLSVDDALVEVGAGQLYLVPAGLPHAVAPGSQGTLVIID
ncbi:hypothetical protein GCM10007907_36360 [Chitinimonas prasina]|uniref:Cupin type-2 domain-containing protein n=2 Tax=Chitinimonas TaxID=240411 RepID=A0ABQ5YJS1_9NEIS|nr:cupin domain-containing protein [Chitinimonas prasina]GLR14846.1 hypothetical protein GCM10007907_36360 [Chitinimonas prasina]